MTTGGGVFLLGAEGQGFMRHCVAIERRDDDMLVGDDCGWYRLAAHAWIEEKISFCLRVKIVKPHTEQEWKPEKVKTGQLIIAFIDRYLTTL